MTPFEGKLAENKLLFQWEWNEEQTYGCVRGPHDGTVVAWVKPMSNSSRWGAFYRCGGEEAKQLCSSQEEAVFCAELWLMGLVRGAQDYVRFFTEQSDRLKAGVEQKAQSEKVARLEYELDGPQTDQWRPLLGLWVDGVETRDPVIRFDVDKDGWPHTTERLMESICGAWNALHDLRSSVAEAAAMRTELATLRAANAQLREQLFGERD